MCCDTERLSWRTCFIDVLTLIYWRQLMNYNLHYGKFGLIGYFYLSRFNFYFYSSSILSDYFCFYSSIFWSYFSQHCQEHRSRWLFVSADAGNLWLLSIQHPSDALLEVAVLGGVDERVNAAVDLHQYESELIKPIAVVCHASNAGSESHNLAGRHTHEESAAYHQSRYSRVPRGCVYGTGSWSGLK